MGKRPQFDELIPIYPNEKINLESLVDDPSARLMDLISPIGKVVDHGKDICFASGMEKMGPVLQKLYDTLTGMQMGRLEAPKGWIYEVK